MGDAKLAGACGIYCGSCEFLGGSCAGCGHIEGKPFWTAEMELEACPLYDCCVNKKELEHCDLCDELPCGMFNEFHDPTLSPEQAKQSVLERGDALRLRKELGTAKWLESMP